MIKRARAKGLVEIHQIDLRLFGEGMHQQVDDRPYGGGPGMVLKAGPLLRAIASVRSKGSRVIYLSPQGTPLTVKKCEQLAKAASHVILICGHYGGIDERVIEMGVDEEISVGDYILTSGAPAAVVFVDAVSRYVPGVLGNAQSPSSDSFARGGIFGGPLYTRPEEIMGSRVPEILRLGHHREIMKWRENKGREKTKRVRPDLAEKANLVDHKETKS